MCAYLSFGVQFELYRRLKNFMPNKRREPLERSWYENARILTDQPTEFRFRRAVGPSGSPLNSLSIEHNDLASGGANESFAFETVQRTGHAGSPDAQHQR